MATRIYALAKELNLESKDLVELCPKAGVTGKGSALASLNEDEVEKIKSFIKGGGRATATATAVAEAPRMAPPVKPVAAGPVPMLATPRAAAPPTPVSAPAPKAPPAIAAEAPVAPVSRPVPVEVGNVAPPVVEAEAPAAPAAPLAPPTAPVAPLSPVSASGAPARSGPLSAAVHGRSSAGPNRRDDYIGPGGGNSSSKLPMLGQKSSSGGEKKKPDGKPPIKVQPSIRLARMPDAAQPKAPTPGANEPAPQKPDIRLPPDAIRASKAGTKPLQDHIRKTEEKRKLEAAGGAKKPALPAKPTTTEPPKRGRRNAAGELIPDEDAGMSGGEGRRLLRKKTGSKRSRGDEEGGSISSPRKHIIHKRGINTAAPRKGKAVLQLPATVRSFSEAAGVPASKVLAKLMQQFGKMGNINAEIDDETVQLLAVEMGVEIEFKQQENLEDSLLSSMDSQDDNPDDLVNRAPVVTFLGHVDHGKTSLLDKIIGINVVSGESGGITQHIRAYRVEHQGKPITFVDTPGHEAFTEMRARGANVTDIAVLVVAANDGVMPQTEEAISHARAAGVPIVVALNKIDLPGIDQEKTFQQLAVNELLPTQWGGDVEVVPCSATKGTGLDNLLETLLTVAELHDLKANPKRPAMGTCLEAEMHEGRGVIAKFLVQNGTLRPGDIIVCGSAFGRVRAMFNTLKPTERMDEAGPSVPVNITGLDEAPGAGQKFYVLSDIAEARSIAEKRAADSKAESLGVQKKHITFENLFESLAQEETQTLNLILRADTRGSIEAIKKELVKLEHPEVQIRVLLATVGGITEADVHLADASNAVIIGFNMVPDEKARALADQRGVQVRRYDIIYEITDHLRQALERKLKPEQREVELGRALVKRVFAISRIGTIAGCHVIAGNIERSARARVIRDSQVIGEYTIESLKREKDDAREVRQGLECGIRLAGYNDLKEGDILECYRKEEVARTLS